MIRHRRDEYFSTLPIRRILLFINQSAVLARGLNGLAWVTGPPNLEPDLA